MIDEEGRHYLEACAEAARTKGDTGLDVCADLLGELIATGAHKRILNRFVVEKCGNLDFEGDDVRGIETSGRFIVLCETDDVQLAVIRQMNVTSHIYSSPNEFVQAKVSAGAVRLATYALPAGFQEEVFDPEAALVPTGRREISDASPMIKRLDNVIDIDRFDIAPVVLVRLSFFPRGDYEWAFDRVSLTASAYTTIRLPETNLCGILDLLAAAGDESTADRIEPLLDHELHFVRWRAVQTVGALDRERGLAMARRATDDRHPAVRDAARRTLATMPH